MEYMIISDYRRKNPCNLGAACGRPPTARELDRARGGVASAARSGYDLKLAWVRGRHDTGASLPVMQPGPSKAAALGYELVPKPPAPP